MKKEPDIRWQQRLNNFKKALSQLDAFIQKGELNELEKQGLIKAFEYTYELAWTTLKDYLEYQGYTELRGSRDTIRQAFQSGLIEDGEGWMTMYQSRMKKVHTYNEETAESIAKDIVNSFHPLFHELMQKLTDEEKRLT